MAAASPNDSFRRALRRLLVLSALGLACFAATAATADAAAPGLDTDLTWGISSSDQDRTVAAMSDVGAKWTRLTIQWKAWETSPGVYNPNEVARTDRAVQLCNAAGIKVLLEVHNAPAWASSTNDSGQGNVPRNPADYGTFLRYVATRYKGQVAAYEMWNEPDIQRFWNPGPNAAAYTAVLKAGYAGVKGVDPSALVVSGGLSWDYDGASSFLGRMYSAGAKGSFDVVGLHDYPVGSLSTNLATWPSERRNAHQLMLANGDDKPVWITEFGFNTSSDSGAWQPPVTLLQQANLVTTAFQLLAQDPWVQVAFYYNFRNNWWQHDDMSSMEAQFGLMSTDFTPKLSYYAFKAVGIASPASPPPPPPAPPSPPPAPPSPPPAPPADSAPQVVLTAPALNSTFGPSISFAATAQDDKGISKVKFYFDGALVGSDSSAPYTATWAVPSWVSYDIHRVSAVAVDSSGQTTSTALVPILRVKKRKHGVTFAAAPKASTAMAQTELFAAVFGAPFQSR